MYIYTYILYIYIFVYIYMCIYTYMYICAQCVVGTSRRPFGQVSGPAGAMIASCMRIGWKSPSPRYFINASGVLLDLDVVCPMQIKLHANDDSLRSDASISSLAARIGGPPDL